MPHRDIFFLKTTVCLLNINSQLPVKKNGKNFGNIVVRREKMGKYLFGILYYFVIIVIVFYYVTLLKTCLCICVILPF